MHGGEGMSKIGCPNGCKNAAFIVDIEVDENRELVASPHFREFPACCFHCYVCGDKCVEVKA